MKAELISIGDEILIGQIVNTNSVFLAKQFNRIGVEIVQITAISDHKNVIIDALDQARKRADIIVFTKSEEMQPHKKVLNHAKKTKLPIFYSSVKLSGFSKNDSTIYEPAPNTRAVAVSAIADPKSFYRSLENTSIDVVSKISFFDHYEFKQTDINNFKETLEKNNAELIVTTEKDLMRLSGLNLHGVEVYTLNIEFSLDDDGVDYLNSFLN